MSAIVGFIGNNAPTSLISKKDYNSDSFWTDQFCTIGYHQLNSGNNQPTQSKCGRFVIVFDGSIFNKTELIDEIKKNKSNCNLSSDAEIAIEAFSLWKEQMTDRINGVFAIAIYDLSTKKTYLLRDRIGIKPLFYCHYDNHFFFTSELKAFQNIPEIKSKLALDYQAIAYYLHLGYIPAPFTIWEKIKKFPQASIGVFENKTLSINKYWDLQKINIPLIFDENKAEQQLEDLLLSSVRYHLHSNKPIGAFLSGGIDSSLITALAQHLSPDPIYTFSIGFANSQKNELSYAKAVAAHLQTNHHEFTMTGKDVLDLIPEIANVYDEPFPDDSALPSMLVSKLAREKVETALVGDGGDELFMGYGAYNWAERLNNPFIKALHKPLSLAMSLGNQRLQKASWLFNYPSTRHLPSHIFSQEQYFFSRNEVLLHFPFTFEKESSMQEWYALPNRKISPSENQTLFDFHYCLPDMVVVKMERASKHYSLETCVPILNYHIVEFAHNIEKSLRINNGEQKYLLKKILYKYIPQEIFNRPKWGFSMPLHSWMRQDLKDFIFDNLHSSKLTSLLKKPISKNSFYISWEKGNDLHYNKMWQLAMLNLWLDRNL